MIPRKDSATEDQISEPRYRDIEDDDGPASSSSNTLAATEEDADHDGDGDGDVDALSFLQVQDRGEYDEELSGMVWQQQKSKFAAFFRPSPRLQRAWRATAKWVKGPQPPRPWRIVPFFEEYQTLPLKIIDQYFPKRRHKIGLLAVFYSLWLLTFSLVLKKSAFASDVPGYGSPVNIGCLSKFWNRHNHCGLNGDQCRPFNNATFTFRCPASCIKAEVLEPYAVGGQMVNYRPLVIGGPEEDGKGYASSIYRADSYICSAAIHAGYIDDEKGGCGVMKLIGDRNGYSSDKRNGIESIAFDSWFPKSFEFVKDTASTCQDLRWPLLAVSVIFSSILSLCTASSSVFFWSIFTGLFVHVALVSDPPGYADYRALISIMLGRFLPAAFCAAVMYLVAVRFTLRNLTAQVEKTVLWLGACWVGSLNNYTFDKIPISRLTPHDIQQQPGAIPALLTIITVLLSIVLSQAWFIRIEGLMPKYLLIYGLLVTGVLILVAIPGLKVRIHHYILGLIFIPGTRLQMRASLLYQGLLVGLFINGIARWGFDSILQTPYELRGEAPMDTELPVILPPIIHPSIGKIPANITFEWVFPEDDVEYEGEKYDGISILVNDVERFRGYRDQQVDTWTWKRLHGEVPEYFRFAYMMGGDTGDYTKAGTWDKDDWIAMEPGPS